MRLTDFIPRKAILPSLKAANKKAVITELVTALRKAADGEKFAVVEVAEAVLDREKIGSTGLGAGVAVPHAKIESLKGVLGAFGRCAGGVDFNSVDGEPVSLVFLIVAPPQKNEEYLQALQKTMRAIKQPNVCKFLRAAKTAKEIEDLFRETEEVAKV
ncbi:MAG: PTS sugar transporter subunit IIA [Planctomycetes bacterium]|nr:PTS sugar transporter subunit IIA [Planctomycetota bacterium]